MDPHVSVVIPTYDRPRLLERAVESVLKQTYEDYEVIVVDDASPTDIRSVVDSFDDSRIQYVAHEENRGAAVARNTGIEAATGELIAFLDSDDEWLPDKLGKQVDALADGSDNVGAVYCDYYLQDDEIQLLKRVDGPDYTGQVFERLLSGWCPATTSMFVVRARCFRKVGGFSSGVPSFEDYDMWTRLAAEFEFEKIPEPLVVKHEHSGVQISVDPETRTEGLDGFLAKWGEEMAVYAGEDTLERFRKTVEHEIAWTRAFESLDAGRRLEALRELRAALSGANSTEWRRVAAFMLQLLGGRPARDAVKRLYKRACWRRRSDVML